jgi:DNA-binding protein YbaB
MSKRTRESTQQIREHLARLSELRETLVNSQVAEAGSSDGTVEVRIGHQAEHRVRINGYKADGLDNNEIESQIIQAYNLATRQLESQMQAVLENRA